MEVLKTSTDGAAVANLLRDQHLEQVLPQTKGAEQAQEEQRKVDLKKAVEAANEALKIYDTKVQLKIHEPTRVVIVQVLDSKTEKVLRELPHEKILNLVLKFEELMGLLIDEKR